MPRERGIQTPVSVREYITAELNDDYADLNEALSELGEFYDGS